MKELSYQRKTDSRILITRKCTVFSDALLRLSNRKDIIKIKVSDIIRESGYTRTTFYRYFIDKNDLIFWIYKEEADELLKKFIRTGDFYRYLEENFTLFLKHEKFYRSVIKSTDQNSFSELLFEYFYRVGMKYLATVRGSGFSSELLFSLRCFCHCCVDMLKEWILSDAVKSSSDLAIKLYKNVPAVILNQAGTLDITWEKGQIQDWEEATEKLG